MSRYKQARQSDWSWVASDVIARNSWLTYREAFAAELDKAYLAGVRAGLEAAAKAVDETDYVTTTFAGTTYDDGPRTLGAAVRAIRAIDPASLARGEGQRGES